MQSEPNEIPDVLTNAVITPETKRVGNFVALSYGNLDKLGLYYYFHRLDTPGYWEIGLVTAYNDNQLTFTTLHGVNIDISRNDIESGDQFLFRPISGGKRRNTRKRRRSQSTHKRRHRQRR